MNEQDVYQPKLTPARRRALEVLHQHGTARVSNVTDPDRDYVHHQVADWLVEAGYATFAGFRDAVVATRAGHEAAEALTTEGDQ